MSPKKNGWQLKRVLPYVLEQERRLGLTGAKRMYNASDTVRDGDAIVALQGVDRLFVIRRCGEDTYSLVGDIFDHGLMYGVAYESQDSSEVDYDIKISVGCKYRAALNDVSFIILYTYGLKSSLIHPAP